MPRCCSARTSSCTSNSVAELTMSNQNMPTPISRRESSLRIGVGVASALAGASTLLGSPSVSLGADPLAAKISHFAPKAKRIIQLFMPGGPSQVDTFDYKPAIAKYEGQRPSEVDRKSLRNTTNGLFPSPFGFKQYGECGKWVSDIFPHVG